MYGIAASRPMDANGAAATQLGVYGTSGYAYAINDVGQVAGYEHFSYNSYTDALLWTGDVPTIPTTLSGRESAAYAINNAGQVAGWSKTGSETTSGTVWNGSAATTYLTNSSIARSINDTGQVAGNTGSQATVWNGTTPTYLDSLGGGYSEAQANNNAGQVVGYPTASPNASYHATLWNGTTATDLGTLGGYSYATDINDIGIIVGVSFTADGATRAVLWNGTTMIDINSFLDAAIVSAGWVLLDASGINNQGSIIGLATNTTTGITRPYLLTPTSVPVLDANANGPYTVDEGSSVVLNGTGTDHDGDTLIYEWDLDNDGSFETVGASPTFNGIDGLSVHTVHMRVTDTGGLSDTDTTTVTVNNVAPTITGLVSGAAVACGVENSLTVNFTDPALSNDTYTTTIDWGDGSPAQTFHNISTGDVFTHAYALARTYTASVTISDEDGGTSAPVTASLVLNYTLVGGGILQPVNPGPPNSVFKYKGTIPVKIKPQDCDGSYPSTLAPTIMLTQLSGSAPDTSINEPISTSAADTSGVMRFTGSPDNQYIYNLATKPLPDPSATYEIRLF